MKNTFLYIAIGGLLVTASCGKNWLSPAPENTLINEQSIYENPENAVQFVNACYAQLNEWGQHSFSWIGVSSITSDNADKGSDPGDLGTDKNLLDNFAYTATTPSIAEVWFANYVGVGRCNQALDNVPRFTNISEELKSRLVGESLFLRAYYYFNLVRMFGDVPKIDHVFSSDSVEQIVGAYTRAPKSDVYELIIGDLTEAAAKLPGRAAYSATDVGRATNGAALGLLAKVHLYQENWAEAMALTDQLIASGEYSLEPDYAKIWRQSTENGPESLFEVQAQNGAEGWSTGGYSQIQGARGSVSGGYGGWGFNTPSADLVAAYEPGDVRKAGTVYFAGQTLWDGAVVSSSVANPRYNYKSYSSQTQETNYDEWSTGKNIRILRFAEILLINAEAANELGQSAKALESLNKVRARARGGDASVVPDVVTTEQAALRDAIWHERRVELAMEHDRFFDLVRQGRAETVLKAHGKNFIAGKHEVFPIPLEQIIISQGQLVQNPGY